MYRLYGVPFGKVCSRYVVRDCLDNLKFSTGFARSRQQGFRSYVRYRNFSKVKSTLLRSILLFRITYRVRDVLRVQLLGYWPNRGATRKGIQYPVPILAKTARRLETSWHKLFAPETKRRREREKYDTLHDFPISNDYKTFLPGLKYPHLSLFSPFNSVPPRFSSRADTVRWNGVGDSPWRDLSPFAALIDSVGRIIVLRTTRIDFQRKWTRMF